MPSLDGATGWLNSEPLGPAELRGHVVLVNFWTLTCINWLRQEPYVRAWSQAYRDDGLIVIGVHTPEFSFEHDIDGVRQAVEVRDIDYPVAADNDYEVWSAFANHYWPALYFVDAEGIIRDQHFGEGRYEESERVIQRLLGVERELGLRRRVSASRRRPTGTTCAPQRRISAPRAAAARITGTRLTPERWALAGEWTVGPRTSRSTGPAGASPTASTRATRISCCRPERKSRFRSACSSTARPRARRTAWTSTRTGTACSGRAACTSSCASTTGPRADAGDHLPRARRRGLRVHVRVAEMDDWVVVEVASSEPEAELLCSVLRGSGIECLTRLTNSGAGAGDGLGTVGAHDIMVSPQDAQDAREILHEPR